MKVNSYEEFSSMIKAELLDVNVRNGMRSEG